MRPLIDSSIYSRVTAAVAGLWLGAAGAAWAGDGADLGSLQALLNTPNTGLCAIFNMSSCPQVPTITQGVLQVAGLGNNLPEMVRLQNNIPPGSAVSAGNPALALPNPPPTVPATGARIRVFSSKASATATSERAACRADSRRLGAGTSGFDCAVAYAARSF